MTKKNEKMKKKRVFCPWIEYQKTRFYQNPYENLYFFKKYTRLSILKNQRVFYTGITLYLYGVKEKKPKKPQKVRKIKINAF